MTGLSKLLDPTTLARLQAVPLVARSLVEGYVSGSHRSSSYGFSVEFAQHREYTPGDDLRYLDWKVFGRTDKYYLKQFVEETNLVCHLVVDISESMSYRSSAMRMSKLDYARRAAATLAYLVLHHQDSVGLVTFDQEICDYIRPEAQPSYLKPILEVLERVGPQRTTAAAAVLHDLAERLKRRGIVIILSDFFDDTDNLLRALKHLRHRRQEVVAMHVLDPAEIEFPFQKPVRFCGLENIPAITVETRSIRQAYLAEFEKFIRKLKAGCRRYAVDYVLLRTDRMLDDVLADYLESRKHGAL